MTIDELGPIDSDEFDPEDFSSNEATGSWVTTLKISTLQLASYLTDPICKVREYFYTFSSSSLHPPFPWCILVSPSIRSLSI